MNLQELGNSGVQIPDVGLGTWEYTGGSAPLLRGVELGAFLIDTAEAYRTEDAVGEAIKEIRDYVFVATKVSPSHFRRRDLLKAADQSLKRLKIDFIDLYQLHWANPRIPIAETMGAMEELVDAGKVRYIGVSNFSVGLMEEAQAALSRARIVSNQVEFSLTERSIEPEVLPYCQANGITVIAYKPAGAGARQLWQGRRRKGAGRGGGTEREDRRAGGAQLVPAPRTGDGHPQDERVHARRGELRGVGMEPLGRGRGGAGGGVSRAGGAASVVWNPVGRIPLTFF